MSTAETEIRPPVQFRLNRRRALSAAAYLLSKLGNERNYTKLLKLIFFADRFHVRTYLRPVTSDYFYAMKDGPVASYLYDVFRGNVLDESPIVPDPEDKYSVVLVRHSDDFPQLSQSDREALEFSLENFSRFTWKQLIGLTHAYPDWQKYGPALGIKIKSVPMSVEDFFLNADPRDKEFKILGGRDPYEPIPPEQIPMLIEDMRIRSSQVY